MGDQKREIQQGIPKTLIVTNTGKATEIPSSTAEGKQYPKGFLAAVGVKPWGNPDANDWVNRCVKYGNCAAENDTTYYYTGGMTGDYPDIDFDVHYYKPVTIDTKRSGGYINYLKLY